MDFRYDSFSADATILLETHHASIIDQIKRTGQSTRDKTRGN